MSASALQLIQKEKEAKTGFLDLGNCGLTQLPNELFDCVWLEALNLGDYYDYDWKNRRWNRSRNIGKNNKISILPSLFKKLNRLKKLSLNKIGVESIDVLLEVYQLEWLNLYSNPNIECNVLDKLHNIKHLIFCRNGIENYEFLKKLTQLQSLYIEFGKIRNANFLQDMTQLQSLDLRSNKISDASFLQGMTQLQSLNLYNNQISDASFLRGMTQLQSLDLSGNQISDYSFLRGLTQLQSLNLNDNKINDASFLQGLPQLQSLDLRSNQISDASFLQGMTQLQSLDLRSNQISDASFLQGLTKLQSLYLSGNQISDASFLQGMTQLQSLYLSGNQISDASFLQDLLKEGKMSVSLEKYDLAGKINLHGNPLTNPPIETVKEGSEAILRHFERLERENEKAHLYEAKVLLVGRTGAGKTSLRYKLKNPDKALPEADESTSGIDIEAIEFELKSPKGIQFRMNVWDFEGQIISHQTHQFFLTKRSQYVFVADDRTEKVDTDYWFQIVELLSGGSPMLIFHNEKDGDIARLNRKALQKRFGKFLKEKEYRVDLEAVGTGKKFRKKSLLDFEAFLEDLKTALQALPIVGIRLEKSWVDARAAIEDLAKTEATITERELWKICKSQGVTQAQDQKDLSQLFHDLGIFLHFQAAKDEAPNLLSKIVILQNSWATKAVYRVLKSEYLEKEKRGCFKLQDIEKVWKAQSKEGETDYSPFAGELLQLMQKFKICYKVAKTKFFIIPQLLPSNQPADYDFPEGEVWQLRYSYDFMPKGIITRLTVEMHELIARRQTLAWRDGFVLEDRGTTAEVVETYGKREIHIRVTGAHKKMLLNQIGYEMDKINGEFHFNENIEAHKKLPCNCILCEGKENPHFHEYQQLKNLKTEGWSKAPCYTGKPADIDRMLSMILEGKEVEASYYQEIKRDLKNALFNSQKLLDGQREQKIRQKRLERNQEKSHDLLTEIQESSFVNQAEIIEIREKIEEMDFSINLSEIEDFVEAQLASLMEQLPNAEAIVEEWQRVNAVSVQNLDAKAKLKWRINLLIFIIEKEVSTDLKPLFEKLFGMIKEEVKKRRIY